MPSLALALVPLQIMVGSVAPAPACLGPRTEDVQGRIVASGRYEFPSTLLDAFGRLWAAGNRPALPDPADSVSALATGATKLTIVYSRRGCALGVIEIAMGDLFRALQTAVGPAI